MTFSQIWPLSRYSCFYLGSLHPRNFSTKTVPIKTSSFLYMALYYIDIGIWNRWEIWSCEICIRCDTRNVSIRRQISFLMWKNWKARCKTKVFANWGFLKNISLKTFPNLIPMGTKYKSEVTGVIRNFFHSFSLQTSAQRIIFFFTKQLINREWPFQNCDNEIKVIDYLVLR